MREQIVEHDQSAVLNIGYLGDLLIIIVQPTDAFIHLATNVTECISSWGPYHISLCKYWQVTDDQISVLKRDWVGRRVTIKISRVSAWRNCTMVLAEDDPLVTDPLVQELHRAGPFWYREIHFSA